MDCVISVWIFASVFFNITHCLYDLNIYDLGRVYIKTLEKYYLPILSLI